MKQNQLAAIEAQLSKGFDAFYGKAWVPRLREEQSKLAPNAPLDARWDVDVKLASWLLREGKVTEAIEVLASVYRAQGGGPDRGLDLIKQRAIANLRLAEQENCVCEQGGETCIFPFEPNSQHTKRDGATRAAQLLVQGLEWNPRDLHSIWLLNLCHMALGRFPEGVPVLFRIDPRRLESEFDIGRLENIAPSLGLQRRACAGGAIVDDFDGDGDFDADGLIDLYVSNYSGANRLHHNQGNGKFVDRAADLGVLEPIESFATWWFDVNNDGWLDLFVDNHADRDRTGDVAAYYKNGTTGSDSARVSMNIGGARFADESQQLRIARPYFPMRSLAVTWPLGKSVEHFDNVPLDQVVSITEGNGTFQVVPTTPIVFK